MHAHRHISPTTAPQNQPHRPTPTAPNTHHAAFLEGGETLVGRAARGRPAATTYYSVKRLIGRRADDAVAQEESQRAAFEVAADEEGSVVLTCPHVEPGALYPEEVSACVLAQLLQVRWGLGGVGAFRWGFKWGLAGVVGLE